MPKVLFVEADGIQRLVDANVGESLMSTAIRSNIKGIEADCGGSCSCATCHVYVDPVCLQMIPRPESNEMEMLEGVAAERRANSRLSCQIVATNGIDGLKVEIPEKQS
ncbi:2Fe-2S iron-sulfur cluster-binding protein [Pseudolabrys sp.]|uniref:2Fe-2S iron-sulfur cluster-binding protein n=1 Tax=Pseudolabrys sp. TaxID=1960880 RepID=UPI003D146CBF